MCRETQYMKNKSILLLIGQAKHAIFPFLRTRLRTLNNCKLRSLLNSL